MIAFKQLLIIFLIFYSFLLLFLYFQQKKFIFFPTQAKQNLKETGSITFSLKNREATLNGWLINHKYANEKLIIYYGGNAEDIFLSVDDFKKYSDTATLLVNYRGYGSSSGEPSEEAFFADALAIFDEIKKEYSPRMLYLIGRSLGSGVATYVAANRDIDGVILITPFSSIESLAKRQYPYLPISLLLHHKFRSIDHVKKLSAPCLIIYGGNDRIVPPVNTEKLIEHIEGKKEVVFIEEAEHNNIELFEEYNLALLRFLQ